MTPDSDPDRYQNRLAFDIWANDCRNEAITIENWPFGRPDDRTVSGIIKALDLQAESGYNVVDICGFWATYLWPVNIDSVRDRDPNRRINQLLKAAHERGIKVRTFPCGIMNWGFDEIIQSAPAMRSDNKHNMNPLREESWQWANRSFDFVVDNCEIDGFHLESEVHGRCKSPECAE